MVIGLLGGSFDPAHMGHVHITCEALKRMRLNRVWWLVSPRNPLKEHGPAPLSDRVARARFLMRDPRVVVTDLEVRLGTVRTVDTVARLQALYPGVRFVWLMGADNLVQFHRWECWQEILCRVPVGVLARPGWSLRGLTSKAARVFSGERVGRGEALRTRGAPTWRLVNLPMDGSSSSEIRARGKWRR